ncbi:MAG: uracil-DNA glycosylase [Dehalococcoidia bacterium]|nr:uracil-DNA glycosylase [Dehalococcoidia bacterium]
MSERGLRLKPGATQEQYLWFRDVAQRAYDCRRCPRMEAHSAVLGPLNGRLEARVLVVGEAPGRFGAAVTRIPFRGDRSGENFERLLPSAGLRREDLFIANAAQCNPKDAKGRNDAPTPRELRNCSDYLREMLDIIQPLYVVTLGRKALDALHIMEPHAVSLSSGVATAIPWRGATLVPLYHPSGRALARRSFQQQAEDYAALGRILRADSRLTWADVPQEQQYAAPV